MFSVKNVKMNEFENTMLDEKLKHTDHRKIFIISRFHVLFLGIFCLFFSWNWFIEEKLVDHFSKFKEKWDFEQLIVLESELKTKNTMSTAKPDEITVTESTALPTTILTTTTTQCSRMRVVRPN